MQFFNRLYFCNALLKLSAGKKKEKIKEEKKKKKEKKGRKKKERKKKKKFCQCFLILYHLVHLNFYLLLMIL